MDLNVDRLTQNMIAVAHNGIQNGEVMADPDVQIMIYPESKSSEGITFQNDYLGIHQEVYSEDEKCNERLKREISIFLDDWLSNIINCEYQLTETED